MYVHVHTSKDFSPFNSENPQIINRRRLRLNSSQNIIPCIVIINKSTHFFHLILIQDYISECKKKLLSIDFYDINKQIKIFV